MFSLVELIDIFYHAIIKRRLHFQFYFDLSAIEDENKSD